MEKARTLLVLSISFILIFILYMSVYTGAFVGFGSPQSNDWWNISWHYRIRLEINSTQYNRTDWPVEQQINFTDLLPSGTFDLNSTRVFEYSPSGVRLYEVSSQFEQNENFNASSNALGTLVFMMNGTTNANANRTFYVYYDSIENGAKTNPNYPISVNYSWDGEVIRVNNSFLKMYIDTVRGENTSGLYHVRNGEEEGEYEIFSEISNGRTTEYSEYSNGTHNFSFDLRNNATFINGTVRLIIEQRGNETIFNSTQTNEGEITKRYYIYNIAGPQNKGTFIKIWQRFKNNAGYSIQRNSTPAGALVFDLNRTFASGAIVFQDSNNTNPYSWSMANSLSANEIVGIINLNQSGTTNYFATNASSFGRIGIQLNSTTINTNSTIEQNSLVYFGLGGTEAVAEFENIRDRTRTPLQITQYLPEVWHVDAIPSTNETIYNKNETVLIIGNISSGDYYNLTEYMNATIDMGTVSTGDDQTIILYDDGSHGDGNVNDKIFANNFQIPNTGKIGIWSINFTIYSNDSIFLNFTNYTFNVTDILNVTINITNPVGLIERTVFANIYIRNYRNDALLPEASINCTFDSTEVINKTDWLNGTYSVNFTAPNQEGDFNLTCNATNNNNTGNNYDGFTTEATKTNVSITAQPSEVTLTNITLHDNQSFITTVNASNLLNGTAYNSNISLELGGWGSNETISQCENINKSSFCIKSFNITATNATVPGNYYVNVSVNWTNPDGTLGTNITSLNVTVESNPKINVSKETLTGIAGDGANIYLFNLTVLSIGNDALQNITFNCYSGTVCNDFVVNFTPTNVSSLSMGNNYSVAVNVSVPLGYSVGNYSGIVNVSTQNDGYKNLTLNVSIASKTNTSIILGFSNYTSRNITKFDNESFVFNTTVMNIGNGSARYTNISLIVPSNFSSNSTLENCNNLTKDQTCTKAFNITVPNATVPGNYYVNVSVNWTNPDGTLGTNITSLNVTVESNPKINLSESSLLGSVGDASNSYIGNFTVLSIGNDALQNITFNCYSGTVCNDFVVNFTPTNVSSLSMGNNYSVAVNVSVPLGYSVGNYSGIVNVSTQNDGYKNLTLNVSVPSNRTWTMSTNPTPCRRSETPEEGTVCEVLVRNIGNDIINFTISPENGNYTKVNITNFSIDRWTNYTFNVTYNVTNITQAIYNSLFVIDANQSNSNPDNMTLNVTLYPYLPPFVNFTITPNSTEQNASILILADVTDISNSGLVWVNISVTTPYGVTNQTNMTLVSSNGNFSQWNFTYPDDLGNTSFRGIYNVTVTALDNIGNIGNLTQNFSIYSKLSIASTTLSNTYLQGDTGSIYYVARNASQSPLSGINVTFFIKNSNDNITYYSTGQTNSEGNIYPLPNFVLATDAPTGNYTLFSNATYYDDVLNKSILIQKNSTFLVNARTVTVTGLFADIETAVTWYPNNVMRFGILVYNGEGRPTDPDNMNLTVYDPANNLYFTINISNMTRQATGYYTYSHAMGIGTAVGMYLGVLNVSQGGFNTMKLKAFRVSQGGPYDVWINLFEYEVPQGDVLDFAINIENKGEVSQDVHLQYWISDINNVTYFSNSQDVYTPAVSNQSFTRTAFIESDQPLGTYYLNVKVTYSSVTPSIVANSSFVVVIGQGPIYPPRPPTPPPIYIYGPSGGIVTTYPPQPTEKIKPSILISRYNTNITLARGISRMESVTVTNNGLGNLTNVSLFLIGVSTNWFNITPERYLELRPDNSSVFLIEFNVPKDAKIGEFDANLIASAGVVTDQKPIKITVYEDVKDLLREEISKLKKDVEKLKTDITIAKSDGKDVSNIMLIVNETEKQISDAEIELENNNTESAMDKVQNAINLIKKARDMLSGLQVEKVPTVFSIWIVLIIIIIIAGIVFAILYLWKKKKIEKIRSYIIPLGRLVEAVKKKEVDKTSLENERDKINRMLMVLEKEKNEGMISSSSYDKMKKNLEEKLNEIDKKMK